MSQQPSPASASPGLGYHPALDGMRTFAVVVVCAFHAHLLPGGYLGVDVFFVLSGFLITTLLLDEWQATHSLNIPYFYLRRAARLIPALSVLLLVYVMLLPLIRLRFPDAGPVASREMLYAFSYVMNWGLAFEQLVAPFLSHTWTLAIEEQFYLIWPIVLITLLRVVPRRFLGMSMLIGAAAVWCYRALLISDGVWLARVYLGSDAHADMLLIGAAAAAFRWNGYQLRLVAPGTPWLLLGSIAAIIAGTYIAYDALVLLVIFPTLAAGTTCLILHLVAPTPSPVRTLFARRPLVWIGQRSYGIYLWHHPLMVAMHMFAVPKPLIFLLGGALSIAIAAYSFTYIEQPLVRLARRRFAVRAAHG